MANAESRNVKSERDLLGAGKMTENRNVVLIIICQVYYRWRDIPRLHTSLQ